VLEALYTHTFLISFISQRWSISRQKM